MNRPPHHPLTLRFCSDRLEAAFRSSYVEESLRQVRFALLLGVAMYGGVFGAMDVLAAPALAPAAWAIRLAVCALALGVFALTYRPAFKRLMQPALSSFQSSCSLSSERRT